MEWTNWRMPTLVTEFEPDDVVYTHLQPRNLVSAMPINGVSTGFSQLREQGIHALQFTGWGWEPGVIRHIELRVHVSRLARVKDLTVQLVHDGELIGKNLADLNAEDVHVYGGALDIWNIKTIDPESISVVLDYQPHPTMPSSELVYLRKVQMRMAYGISRISGTIGSNSAQLSAEF